MGTPRQFNLTLSQSPAPLPEVDQLAALIEAELQELGRSATHCARQRGRGHSLLTPGGIRHQDDGGSTRTRSAAFLLLSAEHGRSGTYLFFLGAVPPRRGLRKGTAPMSRHREFSEAALAELLRALRARSASRPDDPVSSPHGRLFGRTAWPAACAELRRRGHPVQRVSKLSAKRSRNGDGWAVGVAAEDGVPTLIIVADAATDRPSRSSDRISRALLGAEGGNRRGEAALVSVAGTPADAAENDDAIRAVVTRLSRPGPGGGAVVERAAILAEGADSAAIITWILARAGQPEAIAPPASTRGLHGARSERRRSVTERRPPRRYVLPASALT